MLSLFDVTLSSLTLACLCGSGYLLQRIGSLKCQLVAKKLEIQATEEGLWQLNADLSRLILAKLRLVDRLSSSSQV